MSELDKTQWQTADNPDEEEGEDEDDEMDDDEYSSGDEYGIDDDFSVVNSKDLKSKLTYCWNR